MADVTIGTQKAYTQVQNGTDKVEVSFIDDYSKMGLKVTDAAGAVSYYEVAIAVRV